MNWISLDDVIINLDKVYSITKDDERNRINFHLLKYEGTPAYVEYYNKETRDKVFNRILKGITKGNY